LAQVNLYPAHYTLASEVCRLYNPSLVNKDSKISIDLGNQYYSGLYNKIENHYFLASVNLNAKDSARTRNNLGLKAANEKEGDFISRPKIYLSYAWHIRLSEKYYLGAGANVGLVGYIYKATNVSGGGSATVPDAELGISFYGNGYTLGISANQLFNKQIQPKELTFKWHRFLSLYAEKKIILGENSSLTLFAQDQLLPETKDALDLGFYFLLNRYIEIGASDYWGQKLSFMVGLKKVQWANNSINLIFCYSIPHTSSSQANNQSFEIVLSYQRF
jgi:hypothetical protein